MTLGKKIKKIAKSNRVLFTTPSHDGNSFIIPDIEEFFGRNFFFHDFSEINGLDNLAAPNGDIFESMQYSANLIGVQNLFYLVNGSTSGILASMLATLTQNDKVVISRNCHKSVLNGLVLTGAKPIWILPEINTDWGIFCSVDADVILKCLSENSDVKVVIITSPTYEGVSSDIEKIAEICHYYGAVLIVDEAHGALKSFTPNLFGKSALLSGADISIQSLHKTCGAPNPCAILQSNGKVPSSRIQNALNLINTSSPSYPILSAIEGTINYLFSKNGQKKIYELVSLINKFKLSFRANCNIKFYNENDPTKIVVKVNGYSGFQLSDRLFNDFNIEDELANSAASMLLCGIGTTERKLIILENALSTIALDKSSSSDVYKVVPLRVERAEMTPREAFFAEKDVVNIENALGKICGEVFVEYPPGIPLLIPGETISQSQIDYMKESKTSIYIVR